MPPTFHKRQHNTVTGKTREAHIGIISQYTSPTLTKFYSLLTGLNKNLENARFALTKYGRINYEQIDNLGHTAQLHAAERL